MLVAGWWGSGRMWWGGRGKVGEWCGVRAGVWCELVILLVL